MQNFRELSRNDFFKKELYWLKSILGGRSDVKNVEHSVIIDTPVSKLVYDNSSYAHGDDFFKAKHSEIIRFKQRQIRKPITD